MDRKKPIEFMAMAPSLLRPFCFAPWRTAAV